MAAALTTTVWQLVGHAIRPAAACAARVALAAAPARRLRAPACAPVVGWTVRAAATSAPGGADDDGGGDDDLVRMGDGDEDDGRRRIPLPPRRHLRAAFSRSSGAGGQNVNKLNTKAEVRFVVAEAPWLDPEVRARLWELYGGTAGTRDGELVVTSQRHRTQAGNLADAITKLRDMVAAAARTPAVREQRAGVGEATKASWREDKRRRSEVKGARRSGGGGGWDD